MIGMLAAGIAVLAVATLLRPITPALEFNSGFGFLDGQSYGAMARTFRTGERFDILSPYVFRVLPAALVAWSGASYRLGFLVLNVLGYVVAAVALYGLMAHYAIRSRTALLLVVWWAVLPAGVRLAEYYPVLVDGVGSAFSGALLWAAATGISIAFMAVLMLGVLARENLLVLAPLPFLAQRRAGLVGAARQATVLALPAVATLLWVHRWPPIPAANGFSMFDDVMRNWGWFTQNADARFWRFLAAPPLTLGMFFAVPLLHPRRSLAFLREHPEWIYYLAVSLALAPIGGGDFDRFAFLLAPALVLLTATVATFDGPRMVLYTLMHLIGVRALIPVGSGEASYRAYNVATMDLATLVQLLVVAVALATVYYAVDRVLRGYIPQYRI
ncbi:MAG TPA: hypothetical protein VGT60_12730 [Candidatus Limnocylindria bacterium]|nr:hypothetical protein [Candidatus Limnocylindria bacterium]